MSNHAGSSLLCEVLGILDRYGVFTRLGRAQSQQMVLEIVTRACRHYDCNSGEVLEGHGELLGICYGCLATDQELEKGLCKRCRA